MKITEGRSLYYLYHGTHSPNDLEQVVIEMKVVKKDGVLMAMSQSKDIHWIKFEVSEEKINQYNQQLKTVFQTKEEAVEEYRRKIDGWVQDIHELSKEELLKQLYGEWLGEHLIHIDILNAMKTKIKREFDVDVN